MQIKLFEPHTKICNGDIGKFGRSADSVGMSGSDDGEATDAGLRLV